LEVQQEVQQVVQWVYQDIEDETDNIDMVVLEDNIGMVVLEDNNDMVREDKVVVLGDKDMARVKKEEDKLYYTMRVVYMEVN
jgi:hypothetical protein